MFVVAAFYHFFDFADAAARRAELLKLLKSHSIKGSILIAAEGFNGTISGGREGVDAVLAHLENIGGAFDHKESLSETQPFGRAKVRLKKEIISLHHPRLERGSSEVNCPRSPLKAGMYVNPRDWNALIADPQVTVIDARNAYETHLGMFRDAIDPNTRNFKELPVFALNRLDPTLHKKIAAYCTGGIRCEKFAPWLIARGFEEVYQLKGGILQYLEEVPREHSLFDGECYVFDERVAVGHGLAPSRTASMCKACGYALTEKDRSQARYVEHEACPHCKKYA